MRNDCNPSTRKRTPFRPPLAKPWCMGTTSGTDVCGYCLCFLEGKQKARSAVQVFREAPAFHYDLLFAAAGSLGRCPTRCLNYLKASTMIPKSLLASLGPGSLGLRRSPESRLRVGSATTKFAI